MSRMAAPDPKAFLGVGWAFPFRIDADGGIGTAIHEDDVHQSIRIILGTSPGERVMRPTFGAGLNAFLFEPINVTTLTQVQARVRDALIDWEPRIEVTTVRATRDASEPGKVNIEIQYRVRATNAVGNLVYPFYLQEGPARS